MAKIRYADLNDFKRLCELEYTCFGEHEMVAPNGLKRRLEQCPEHTLVLEEDKQVVAYVTYVLSEHFYLDDVYFGEDAYDDKEGAYCIIIGVATDPNYQKRGYSSLLIERLFKEVDKPMLLTCHEYLIKFYERFGFKYINTSSSTFNGDVWYNMTYNTDIIPTK